MTREGSMVAQQAADELSNGFESQHKVEKFLTPLGGERKLLVLAHTHKYGEPSFIGKVENLLNNF